VGEGRRTGAVTFHSGSLRDAILQAFRNLRLRSNDARVDADSLRDCHMRAVGRRSVGWLRGQTADPECAGPGRAACRANTPGWVASRGYPCGASRVCDSISAVCTGYLSTADYQRAKGCVRTEANGTFGE